MTAPADVLDQLDALRAAATPGPWEVRPYWFDQARAADVMADGARITTDLIDADDAALIVAAVNSLPDLTAALRAVLVLADLWDGEPNLGGIGVADRIRTAIADALARPDDVTTEGERR